ncbi:ribose-phosphate diphosphokinase family member [Holotrichia oblita]|nr:ribose-phosphate diphosphokinase family member [Holotrichia oblita]
MIDAFKRASAGRITAVMPYYGYARQDRKAKARDAISAKLVADLITVAGADRLLTMDLHSPQIQGCEDDVICVSPDIGSVTRARGFAQRFGSGIAIIDKRRQKANVSEVMNIIGDVKDKTVIIVDDMVDTAGRSVTQQERL